MKKMMWLIENYRNYYYVTLFQHFNESLNESLKKKRYKILNKLF